MRDETQHKPVEQPPRIVGMVTSRGVLHTFEDKADVLAFMELVEHWSQAAWLDGHVHHPKARGE